MQDLTPQLRTRLSRVERAVGVFVLIATLLLLSGFGYYLWHTAETKGWFVTKVRYFTYVDTATGLKLGTPVKLMGRDIGEITKVEPMPPYSTEGDIYVEFIVKAPHYGYLWTKGSYAHINASDFLGNRYIDVTKGTNGGVPTYVFWPTRELAVRDAVAFQPEELKNYGYFAHIEEPQSTNRIAEATGKLKKEQLQRIAALGIRTLVVFDQHAERKDPTFVWDDHTGAYLPATKKSIYYLKERESPALTERLEKMATQIELALPGILNLTNRIDSVLTNANHLLTNINAVVSSARPVISEATNAIASIRPTMAAATNLLLSFQPAISNVTVITANLTNSQGALGEWLIPTGIHAQLRLTLTNVAGALNTATSTIARANVTMQNVDTNLSYLVLQLSRTLEELTGITGNLHAQVDRNTNLVSEVSSAIVHADELLQGLKRHWLLRSAFKTNAPPKKSTNSPPSQTKPLPSGRQR